MIVQHLFVFKLILSIILIFTLKVFECIVMFAIVMCIFVYLNIVKQQQKKTLKNYIQ